MKRILLIEDDQEIRETISEILMDEGYQVTSARNGKDGLDQLGAAQELPELIILDLMMPVMNGNEFLEEKIKDPRIANIPTAVLSADVNALKKAKDSGAQYALKKPVDLDELLSFVSSAP